MPVLKIRRLLHSVAIAAVLIPVAVAPAGHAQSPLAFGAETGVIGGDPNLPFLLEADALRYEQESDTFFAEGDVEITREGRVLTADQIEYRRRDRIVAARGNVTLVEPSGEVLFADEVELTEALDQGFAVAPRLQLADGSRLAANSATRVSEERVEIKRVVYSPCFINPSCPDRAPLWQIRAENVTHSESRRELEFYDASLDIFGVPVAWFPYFSQPDPRVTRKTGFLMPTFGSDDDLGLIARTPFFWNIAPNQDLTFTPIVTSNEYPVGLAEFRHLFPWGKTALEASFGIVERRENDRSIGNKPRGHVKWTGDASIDENWRANLQFYRSGDDTYLRRFNIDSAGVLRSFATLEGFYDHAYINATAFSVQEQRINFTDNDTPDALPYITASYQRPLGNTGFTLTGNAGFQTLFRTEGADSQHLATQVGVGREWIVDGHLLETKASVRGDLFYAEDLPGRVDDDEFGTRFMPRATLGWSYPVFRALGENAVLTLTPRAMATATVGSVNTDDLPNEDSQSVEFDSTALFRPSIAAGRNRYDDGQRLDFGLEAALDFPDLRLTGIVGQSYRVNSSRDYGEGTGLNRPFSDFVIGAGAQVQDWLDGATRVRLDARSGAISATETRMRLGYNPLQLTLSHTMFDARTADGETLDEIHQVDATLRAQFSDHWAGFVRHQRDLDLDEALRSQIGLAYVDECLRFETVFTREAFENAEVRDNDSVIFRIVLRNFGADSNAQGFAR